MCLLSFCSTGLDTGGETERLFFFSIPAGCLPPQTSAQFPEAIKLVCTWQSVTAISCEM